ncbi:glutaredoxin [Salirhabdus euzebyi]|uniref:Glutaredoxin n=1 Tax=Salirhabdus euzebyi TaxID=394506 RepID=A0A841Q6M4_9BACI|nr:glutaredoxin family protein [Salirhabdus euzebyi]MBB6454179.1 glutaredoxin [Salirhabdus euzebyi]
MGQREIVVYTSYDCVQSEKVIEQLEKWDIEYKEKNVSSNHEHLEHLQRKGIFGTPTVFVGEDYILGFQKQNLAHKLGVHNNHDE